MTIRRAASTGAIAVLLFASVAAAALPRAGLIVPGRSIGAVRLGETFAAAKKAWGASGSCATLNGLHYCSYAGAATAGRAVFGATKGKVSTVGLSEFYDAATKRFVPNTPLARFQTSTGIHLGSTVAALTRAYPKLTIAGTLYEIRAAARRTTYFEVSGGAVYGIAINVAGA